MRAGSGELNSRRKTGEGCRLQLQFQRDQARQHISLAREWGERKAAFFHVFLTENRIRLRMFART